MMRVCLAVLCLFMVTAAQSAVAQTVTATVTTPATPISAANLTAGTAVTVFTGVTVQLSGCTNDNVGTTTKCSVWLSASPDVGSGGPINNVSLRWGLTQAACTNDVRSGTTPNPADTPVLEVTEPSSGTSTGSRAIWLCMTTASLSWSSGAVTFTPTLYFGRGRN